MAREACHGCFGSGKGTSGGPCIFCGGTGSIWVPDKIKPGGPVRGGRPSGPSWLDNAFEDNLADISMVVVWGLIVYYGLTSTEFEWYIPVIAGFIVGWLVYKLISGPLRPLATLIKYLFYLGLFALAIYGIYQTVVLFQSA
jgi:hypothetical protein